MLILIFAMCAINYVIGKYSNNSLAYVWLEAVKPILKQNFAFIGSSNTDTEMDFVTFED